jgi:hypothetical protein
MKREKRRKKRDFLPPIKSYRRINVYAMFVKRRIEHIRYMFKHTAND